MYKQKNKVSIILPTYNRSEFLPNAIETILAQTFNNWELVIVDDGSTDNTKEIINSFKDDRIYCYSHMHNQGQPEARKTGIKNSTGDFIAFLDDDDTWNTNKLEKQVNVLDADQSVDVVICNFKEVRNNKKILHSLSKYNGYCLKEILTQPKPVFLCFLIRKNIISNLNQFFDDKLITSHEWDLMINLAINKHKFINVNQYLVTWNVHEKSISKNINKEADGLSYIVKKHQKLMAKTIGNYYLGKHYLRIGYLYEKVKSWEKAKNSYYKAFAIDPFRIKNIIFMISSVIGLKHTSKALNLIRKIKLGINV